MYLGIEIGGTKLQLGVGAGDGTPPVAVERTQVVASEGSAGILANVERLALPLIKKHAVRAIGIGFGGPIDRSAGRVVKSHHVSGWSNFPLVQWSQTTLGLPTVVANDADVAGLAEARFGAGRGYDPVFYITVGTGIGGGLILNGQIYSGAGPGAGELGHLRPGLQSESPEQNLESFAAGWGIAAAIQSRLSDTRSFRLDELRAGTAPRRPEDVRQRLIEVEEADEEDAADLLARCGGSPERLTAQIVGQAARDGNRLALEVLRHAWQALGWGIAQMITLLDPAAVVIGGGVSLLGEELFFEPLRREVKRYVFPPYLGIYRIVPSALGEEVVLYGALALAADTPKRRKRS
jgi:glucokinase